MQTMLRAAFAIAVLASAALIPADRARAMPLPAPTVPGAVAANANLIVRVTNVCGVGGCTMVFTKRVQHPPAGFVKRAVPLAIPRTTTALQPVNPPK